MEATDWLNLILGDLAITIFIGGLLMMFINILDLGNKVRLELKNPE